MYNTKSCAKLYLTITALMLVGLIGLAQPSISTYEGKAKFEDHVDSYLSKTIPLVNATHLNRIYDDVLILDIREKKEYNVSHLPGAIFFGSKHPNYGFLEDLAKDQKIVLYCSIGYRSEKMGEKLNRKGFKNVYNLFGSIFAWVNENHPVFDENEKLTNKVHTYNRKWSKWVMNPKYDRVY